MKESKPEQRGHFRFASICTHCLYAEDWVGLERRPLYATSRLTKEVRVLLVRCKKSGQNVRLIKTWKDAKECGYRPRSGKIAKGLYQCRLTD